MDLSRDREQLADSDGAFCIAQRCYAMQLLLDLLHTTGHAAKYP